MFENLEGRIRHNPQQCYITTSSERGLAQSANGAVGVYDQNGFGVRKGSQIRIPGPANLDETAEAYVVGSLALNEVPAFEEHYHPVGSAPWLWSKPKGI
jgi:hypothetical protein